MSDKRQDFLNEAMKHVGEGGSWTWTNSGLGSGNPWCAAFIVAVGRTVGGIMDVVIATNYSAGQMLQDSYNKGYGTYQKGGHNGGNPSPAAGDLLSYNNGSPTSGSGDFAAQHVGIVYSVNGSTVTTVEGNTTGGKVATHTIQSNASNVAVFYRPNWAKVGGSTAGNVGDGGVSVPTYSLSSSDLSYLAWVCQQEQGTVIGSEAEASLMANRFEMFGSKFSSIVTYVRNSGWWASRSTKSSGTPSSGVLDGVKDVLVNGNRTLPTCIDEHDCLSDISSISTGSVSNKSDYVSEKTVVHNRYGSKWTFYCFPDSSSDPFGYTDDAYNKRGGVFMPGTGGTGSYTVGGDLYDTITTRNDSIIREVGYWSTSNDITTSSTNLRCSVINYTTALGSFFKGAISNASGTSVTPGTTADLSNITNTNLRAILQELFNLGYSEAAATGICANIQAESGFNAGLTRKTVGGTSYGLCQWTDTTSPKTTEGTKMKSWVGSKWADNISGQIQYLNYQLRGIYSSTYTKIAKCDNNLEGAKKATEYFLTGFIQLSDSDSELDKRTSYAEEIWKMMILQV